jgi:effector-binding domain-containing protein
LTSIAQGVEVDKGELSRAALEEIERKALQYFPSYKNLDLANIISSFLKLSYIPREILAEINQMQNLSFNKYSCLLILESLVHVKYDETIELYDKLFKQLQKNSLNMNPKLVGRTIQVLLEYK